VGYNTGNHGANAGDGVFQQSTPTADSQRISLPAPTQAITGGDSPECRSTLEELDLHCNDANWREQRSSYGVRGHKSSSVDNERDKGSQGAKDRVEMGGFGMGGYLITNRHHGEGHAREGPASAWRAHPEPNMAQYGPSVRPEEQTPLQWLFGGIEFVVLSFLFCLASLRGLCNLGRGDYDPSKPLALLLVLILPLAQADAGDQVIILAHREHARWMPVSPWSSVALDRDNVGSAATPPCRTGSGLSWLWRC